MNIEQAIFEIRKRLDEIEELMKILPEQKTKSPWLGPDGYSASTKLKKLFDTLGIPDKPSVRRTLTAAMRLMNNGIPADEIKDHKRLHRSIAAKPYIDDFLAGLASAQKSESK